jgi:hypothetical protein
MFLRNKTYYLISLLLKRKVIREKNKLIAYIVGRI